MASNEIAEQLGIGEETVRTHLKKVQAKLGVRNRAHAAAEAVRQQGDDFGQRPSSASSVAALDWFSHSV